MTKKSSKQLFKQKLALGIGLILVFAGVLWMVIDVNLDSPDGQFVEGEHYFLLANPKRVRGNKIEVMEFFSYACIHCYNLDPELTSWEEENKDKARVVRSPLYSNPLWELFARTYYTFHELNVSEENHYAFFAAIHAGRLNLTTQENVADWVDGRGTTAEAFNRTFKSPAINRRIKEADNLQRSMQIASVPTLVVHGKYVVQASRTVGLNRMLDVVDYLILLERGEIDPDKSGKGETEAGSL